MSEYLIQYEQLNATTWAYLSSLLLLALFFKFSRFWSIRNLDLVLLVLLAPGLLMIRSGQTLVLDTFESYQQLEKSTEVPVGLQTDDTTFAVPSADDTDSRLPDAGLPDTESPDTESPDTELLDTEEIVEVFPPSEPASPDEASEEFVASEQATTDENTVDETNAEPSPVEAEKQALEATWRKARNTKWFGFFWLFAASSLLLGRLLLDPTMVRRPLLEPNLSLGGMTFLCAALYIFLMGNVLAGKPTTEDLASVRQADDLINGRQSDQEETPQVSVNGPGLSVLNALPVITARPWVSKNGTVAEQSQRAYSAAAKVIAILGQLAIVLGIIAIGYYHFHNLKMGVGAATIYLMLPYTAMYTGRTSHVLLGALLIWAVVCYRRPMLAGGLMGLAMGAFYYPLFLMPLWVSFYWRRGWSRFGLGVLAAVVVILLSLIFTSESWREYWIQVRQMFGLWEPKLGGLEGIWSLNWNPVYRLPILAAFFSLSVSLAIWPARKHLGTLLSCSAALMVAVQFWHGFGGGLYMAWYLPLLLLTVFRPNLEDRVAIAVLEQPRKNGQNLSVDRAA